MIAQKLALGTVQFGLDYGVSNTDGKVGAGEVARILALAREVGIDTLDTAPAYGDSEGVLGAQALGDFRIITKTAIHPDLRAGVALASARESRRRLGELYGWLYHRFDDYTSGRLRWTEARNIQRQVGIQKIGFSLYDPEEWRRLLRDGVVPDLIQVPYNIFDRRFESIFAEARELGTEIHVRSVFLQGLVFREPIAGQLPIAPTSMAPALRALKKLDDLAGGRRIEEIVRLCLHFVAGNTLVDRLVIGVVNSAQLEANLVAIRDDRPLPPLAELNALATEDVNIINPSRWKK